MCVFCVIIYLPRRGMEVIIMNISMNDKTYDYILKHGAVFTVKPVVAACG